MRADGVLPRFLLVAVLALGVSITHTLGHPDGGSGSGMTHSTGHASGEMRSAAYNGAPGAYGGAPGAYGGDHGAGTAVTGTGPQRAAHAPSAAAGHAPAAPETKPREPMTGMDMASLCVAVLGVWVLGTLLHAVRGPILPRPAPTCSADIGRTARKAPVRPMEQSTLGKRRYIDIIASTRLPRRPLHRRLALVGAVAG
ncbi:hypothetical protein Z951_25500 [Streptomyces sp. PRh5]|uniref:hypothetical protein n=1 Tax=Streptomyces sp. PRh5 TaxID=1158056 RepID=UPI00044D61B8|nr:hypothetical protein [Streptomyces sp. PRh5]EXU65413.1 hypothetical protein Z951_25500 [Streptomyces sp. PRh5]